MRIVELSDYSMVIMKDSEDVPWESVGNIYRKAKKYSDNIQVLKYLEDEFRPKYVSMTSKEFVYSGGMLVLFFSDPVDSRFQLHDTVSLHLSA